jgi:putative YhdH/YhfP family quinone oxidoreductase
MSQAYRALLVEETNGAFRRSIVARSSEDLPSGELLIRVHYSSLNYKDALSATGNRGVTRTFPHVPGIDAAGEVLESRVDAFQPGDPVIVIGHDLGMNTPGGFGEMIRVPASWAVARPPGLSAWESMALGTAGFTAAQCVEALLHQNMEPNAGEVLVTGASGGVGSVAVMLLAQLGFTVVTATGKPEAHDFLRTLGAGAFLSREESVDQSSRPLLRERWAGVVDTVGGAPLATALRSTRYRGSVAACGLVASPNLETTVFPFILRNVSLLGIDSVNYPPALRSRLWHKLAGAWKPAGLTAAARTVALDALEPEIAAILAGRQVGRIVVAHE